MYFEHRYSPGCPGARMVSGWFRMVQGTPGCSRWCQNIPRPSPGGSRCLWVISGFSGPGLARETQDCSSHPGLRERVEETLSAAQETVMKAPEPCTPERVRKGIFSLNCVWTKITIWTVLEHIVHLFYFCCIFVKSLNRKCSHIGSAILDSAIWWELGSTMVDHNFLSAIFVYEFQGIL